MSSNIQRGWAVPKSDDFDLRDFAMGVLGIAKENLARDGELVPIAFVITGDEICSYTITFEDHDQKTAAYRDLVHEAQGANGLALVTCNDAYRSSKSGPGELESYYPGKLAAEGAPECIMLTVSGPAMPVWCVEVPYERKNGAIQFGKETESAGDDVAFLDGWAPVKPRIQ
ncbi:MAG TPA: hypothetical protein VNW97_09985 [Candidatus Saccharimonadales bacterium]|jgi:hypothetical protein|nr:hypothetical protein [Candidatus Saccharimonadales bacterium]